MNVSQLKRTVLLLKYIGEGRLRFCVYNGFARAFIRDCLSSKGENHLRRSDIHCCDHTPSPCSRYNMKKRRKSNSQLERQKGRVSSPPSRSSTYVLWYVDVHKPFANSTTGPSFEERHFVGRNEALRRTVCKHHLHGAGPHLSTRWVVCNACACIGSGSEMVQHICLHLECLQIRVPFEQGRNDIAVAVVKEARLTALRRVEAACTVQSRNTGMP